MAGLVALPLFTGSFGGPTPLEWRSFAFSLTSHHTLILWGYSVLFFALWRLANVKPLVALSAVLMVIATHELFWWSFDTVMTSQVFGYTFHWYWLFGYLLPPCLFWFIAYRAFLPFPRALVLAVFFFDFVWALAGWPVTVNYVGGVYASGPMQGLTVWYNTPVGDGWELASWVVPMLAMWFDRRKLIEGQTYITKHLST